MMEQIYVYCKFLNLLEITHLPDVNFCIICIVRFMYNVFLCVMSITGTFGDGTGLTEVDDCTQCPGGYYCESPGEGSTTAECDPGFFCTIGKTNVQSTYLWTLVINV